jgi:CRP/FNR family transcriptional regulator
MCFTPSTLAAIEKLSITRKYEKIEPVARQGEVWPYLFLVHEGSIDAMKDSLEGRSFVATTFTQGDVFWGLGFFDAHYTMPATLMAHENSVLLLWHREDLMPILLRDGRSSWELARLVVDRLLMAGEKIGDMAFQPVSARLAKLLVAVSKEEVGSSIERSLTLDEMAVRIGTSREVVCRLLHKFSDNGLIDITRTDFRIKNLTGLLGMLENQSSQEPNVPCKDILEELDHDKL